MYNELIILVTANSRCILKSKHVQFIQKLDIQILSIYAHAFIVFIWDLPS